ncbi:response regulator [Geitlerinema sp. PCC 9228]|jgi:signal transduction histidine kinase|uniref:response regulator n=1 Tax=Geitlerinema sp. PCC 9228 TaxID=111611 RepID=UPI0008F9E0D6|nr:response regulator [Geitlerinema sp. PCC 9228]
MNNRSTPPKILVVEDSTANAKLLCQVLQRGGMQVVSAHNGESAIQEVEASLPDLILLDVLLPGMDGFELCQKWKSQPRTQDIPIIFMTALTDNQDKIKGLKLGAVDYVTKPFHQEEVLARVRLHLQLSHLTKTLEKQNQKLSKEVQERKAAEKRLQNLTQTLEERVSNRTQELQNTLDELQTAQVQLVQREKLSTLGQLVAGVAHEINNPVGFVVGNIKYLEEYHNDLLEHLKLYQKHYSEPPDEIQEHKEEIDLDYLVEDIPNILESLKVGMERIRKISLSLRNFSRADDTSRMFVDIHEGLESTLLILKHRLKAKGTFPGIQVEKEYGNLPQVCCYPGQLNQVFTNILANAVDALSEEVEAKQDNLNKKPTITIQTGVGTLSESEVKVPCVTIRIVDNGPGMPEEVQKHLFDPMFTTKPIGKGTGLGMSISHQIVTQKHQGRLRFYSTPGEGTEFIIEVPIQGQDDAAAS